MDNRDAHFEIENRRDSNDFKFWCYRMPDDGENVPLVPPHWHTAMEIVYSETYGTLYINDKAYDMEPGSIFFVNPSVLHRTFRKKHGLMIHIVFDPNLLKISAGNNPCNDLIDDIIAQNRRFKEKVERDSTLYEELLPVVKLILDYAEETVSYGYESCSVISLLYAVFAAAMKANHFEYINAYNLYGMHYVADAMHYIDEHYSENLTVGELAKKINVSPTYLYRLFRDYVGTTPINYINSIRLRAAYKLLDSGHNVTETAMAVGIPNISYFIKLFKSATGETPLSWLKGKGHDK